MMRTPAVLLLTSLCLVACGQSGDLYRPDESAKVSAMTPGASEPAAGPQAPVQPTKDDEEKKDADAAEPASTPAADSTVPSTAKPSSATP